MKRPRKWRDLGNEKWRKREVQRVGTGGRVKRVEKWRKWGREDSRDVKRPGKWRDSGHEESREVMRVEKQGCQERGVCQVSGFTALSRRSCQDLEMLGANRIKRKWHHQKRMSRERNVKDKEFQEITEPMALTTRRSGFVPINSPFSL